MSDIITTYILINGFCFFVFLFYGKILAKKGTFKRILFGIYIPYFNLCTNLRVTIRS